MGALAAATAVSQEEDALAVAAEEASLVEVAAASQLLAKTINIELNKEKETLRANALFFLQHYFRPSSNLLYF